MHPLPSLAIASALCASALSGTSFAATPQQNFLPGTTTYGGVSIPDDFYVDLADAFELQNQDRLHTSKYAPFTSIVVLIDDALATVLQTTGLGAELPLMELANLICATFQSTCGYVQAAAFFAGVACSGDVAKFSLDAPLESAHGVFGIHSSSYSSANGVHSFEMILKDVGMMFSVRSAFDIGDDCGVYEDFLKSGITYDGLTYRVDVDLTTPNPTVSATLIDPLPSDGDWTFQIEGLSASGGELGAAVINQFSGGFAQVYPFLQAWASVEVPAKLEELMAGVWLPYLPTQSGLLDLSAVAQQQAYDDNDVLASIDPPSFFSLDTTTNGDRVRAMFVQGHTAVPKNPQAIFAFPTFQASNALPSFGAENSNDGGIFYISSAAIQHAAEAGVISAVGHRASTKDGGANPMRVSVPLSLLAPAMGKAGVYTVADLLGYDMVSQSLTSSPTGSVPLSDAQITALCEAAPEYSPSGTKVGATLVSSLNLVINIFEVQKDYQFAPLGASSAQGDPDNAIVRHTIGLEVILLGGDGVVASEQFLAEFGSRALLSHSRLDAHHVLSGVQTAILSLVNTKGVNWLDVKGDVANELAVSKGPVSFLLRGLFGERATFASSADKRFFYLLEGLAGPMVERSAQAMVRLPGLDFPAFTFQSGTTEDSEEYFDSCNPGMGITQPILCAQYERWGSADSQIVGLGQTNKMFALEVEWQPTSSLLANTADTVVVTEIFPGHSPEAGSEEFPILQDEGYVTFRYHSVGANQTRVMNATGYRTGVLMGGTGKHYVCATPAAYALRRESIDQGQLLHTELRSSIELVPYRVLTSQVGAGGFGANPVLAGGLDVGTNYETWTFESASSCGPVTCDGERIGVYWGAPLFLPFGADVGAAEFDFSSNLGSIRGGPDGYSLSTIECLIDGGGGDGGSGTFGGDGPSGGGPSGSGN